ncbi:hypothetical protein L916_14348 [Phytophthora nicotianae]|uniref:Uncharacterized protein n=2 Tax=Phytophthora nicotianae TaxID=4792 RepID=W2II22_PHYNI|nr:hypothetical protein L916_14348 [Phytophthora nicotianae]
MQHILRQHPDHEAVKLDATTADTGSMSNLLLAFCENRRTRRYANLDPISVETLRAGMEGVTRAIERKLAAELPPRFGILFDGVVLVTPLLDIASLMNEPDDDLSSRSHYAFLATMLPRDFGVQIDQCRFIVGDNCSVNRLLAMLMGYLLLGALVTG